MEEDQVDRLLTELTKTRASFEQVVKSVRWNRINTIIMYVLIIVVLLLGTGCFGYYLDQKQKDCEQRNTLSQEISQKLDETAFAIGVALSDVSGASDETLEEYITTYLAEAHKEPITTRKC